MFCYAEARRLEPNPPKMATQPNCFGDTVGQISIWLETFQSSSKEFSIFCVLYVEVPDISVNVIFFVHENGTSGRNSELFSAIRNRLVKLANPHK